ncbi:MAG: sulfonate ABC transporter substrate-binding protein [Candidatus Lumbricidophila eiseniae]|uniref:Sulfonate ABC transporter substrate-binding protein n=1 Tax=Candidatus Lumbricidiphila eiseniae TaxID=1969409 RepID=A0A2A6FUG7_9MICO|nr:MAG: sulfonate ABC transporter substrate-binding protein [Candidatus Lumbricidophila eiseniae]
MTRRIRSIGLTTMMTAALVTVLTGCSSPTAASSSNAPASQLRLGYFANVTHAPAIAGLQKGFLQDALGTTKLSTQVFNAGPAEIEALSAGAIDVAYVGPNPAINTYIQSSGASARIIAGVATGGAALVVRSGITSPQDLKGATVATPQLGNTQDVSARTWFAAQGLKTDTQGGGDVHITPTENAQAFTLFQQGKLDAAWVPEPWVSRFTLEAGAHVLVDEASLWPDGAFPTTVLLVSNAYLQKHPDTVTKLLQGHVQSVTWLTAHPGEAPGVVNAGLQAAAGKPLPDAVIAQAMKAVHFSIDPNATAFDTLVSNGVTAGTQKKGSIAGLFDLRLLNQVATAGGQKKVSAGGLGEQ